MLWISFDDCLSKRKERDVNKASYNLELEAKKIWPIEDDNSNVEGKWCKIA